MTGFNRSIISVALIALLLPTSNGCQRAEKFKPLFLYSKLCRFNIIPNFQYIVPYEERRTYSGCQMNKTVNDIISWHFKAIRFESVESHFNVWIDEDTIKFKTECDYINDDICDYNC